MNEQKRRLASGLVLGIVVLLVVSSLGVIASPARAAIIPQWTAAPDMGDARAQAVVVNDEKGLVYVMGGVSAIVGGNYDTTVPNASAYDPDTGVWTDLAPMTTGVRGAAGVFGQDGRIYVIGGSNSSSGVISATQIYDPDLDTWSAGASIPDGSWQARAVAVYDDTIVVAGGEGSGGAVYRYDIGDDSWSVGASMPAALLAGVFVTTGYYSYYFGGSDGGYAARDSAYIYYPWDSWDVLPNMPIAMTAHAGAYAADGLIYVFGGGDTAFNIGTGKTIGYCYNTQTEIWSDLPAMLVGARYLGAAATPDGRVLAIGGNDATVVMDDVQSLTIATVTTVLSSSVVSAGGSILVTVSTDFAYATPMGHYVMPYLADSDGVAYDVKEVYSGIPNSFAFEMTVPVLASPGAYDLILHNLATNFDGWSSWPFELSYPVTVLGSFSIDEQLAMLEANVSALEMAIIQGMVEANASTMAYLQTQLTALQGVLAQLGAGLTTMGAAQSAAMDDLNETLADLQLQLDDFQEQIDRVENKADTAGTYGIVTMVLVIIIIVLVALMVMMARKKP